MRPFTPPNAEPRHTRPVTNYIKRVIIIQAAIPSAVIPVILAKRFGGHPDLGTQILLTTPVNARAEAFHVRRMDKELRAVLRQHVRAVVHG